MIFGRDRRRVWQPTPPSLPILREVGYDSHMLVARIIAGVIGALALIKALPLLAVLYFRWDPIALSIGGVLLLVGLFAFWFALLGNDADELVHMKRTLLAGLVVGVVSFLARFLLALLRGCCAPRPVGFCVGGRGGFGGAAEGGAVSLICIFGKIHDGLRGWA